MRKYIYGLQKPLKLITVDCKVVTVDFRLATTL